MVFSILDIDVFFVDTRNLKLQGNGVLVFVDVHRRGELVVVKASSGTSGLYDSRKRRFIKFIGLAWKTHGMAPYGSIVT